MERAEARHVARPGEGRAEARRRYERKYSGEDEGEVARKARHGAPSLSLASKTLIRRAFGAPPSPRGRRGSCTNVLPSPVSRGKGAFCTPSPPGRRACPRAKTR